jgi:hypothetical protein
MHLHIRENPCLMIALLISSGDSFGCRAKIREKPSAFKDKGDKGATPRTSGLRQMQSLLKDYVSIRVIIRGGRLGAFCATRWYVLRVSAFSMRSNLSMASSSPTCARAAELFEPLDRREPTHLHFGCASIREYDDGKLVHPTQREMMHVRPMRGKPLFTVCYRRHPRPKVRLTALRRQRSHVRIVSGAPIKNKIRDLSLLGGLSHSAVPQSRFERW